MPTYKKLTPAQKDEVRTLALAGNHPSDIAEHYKVAVSTIHNLKKGWEKQGDKFPDLRGTRGKGKIEWPKDNQDQSRNGQQPSRSQGKDLHIVVGNTNVNISSAAKNINIQADGTIKVEF